MTTERAKRIRLIFGIVLSVSLAIAGACLMVACVGIYRSGEHPFSREAVAAGFAPIAFPVCLALALTAAGFILDWVLPKDVEKRSPAKQYSVILKGLHSRTDLERCGETLRKEIAAQQKSRRLHKKIAAALLIGCSIVFLAYAVNSANFHQSEITSSMIRAMYLLVPCMVIPFGYAVFTAYYCRASVQREIALMKQANEIAPVKPGKAEPTADRHIKWESILRYTFAAAGIALLIYGFVTGGTADVLTKAINICTECVGLG